MTRKDYVLLARAIAQAAMYCETQNQKRGVERAAAQIAVELARDNPRFSRALFLTACGFQVA